MRIQILIFFLNLSILSCFESAAENAVKKAKGTGALSIKAFDANNMLLAESESKITDGVASASMVLEREYKQGDYLLIAGANNLNIQLDENIPAVDIYAPKGNLKFPVPFKENGKNYSKECFAGSAHKIMVKTTEESSEYRNVALNTFDVQGESNYYPHASSNTEFGGKSFYSAKNTIDGIKQNARHGIYPYHSWGPDKIDSAWFKIDFGKEVSVDKLVIFNRGEYFNQHDSYWEQVLVEFSDGSKEVIKIGGDHSAQEISICKRNTSWLKFSDFVAHEDKWIAWVEVEVWGWTLMND